MEIENPSTLQCTTGQTARRAARNASITGDATASNLERTHRLILCSTGCTSPASNLPLGDLNHAHHAPTGEQRPRLQQLAFPADAPLRTADQEREFAILRVAGIYGKHLACSCLRDAVPTRESSVVQNLYSPNSTRLKLLKLLSQNGGASRDRSTSPC
jgi:hypothetical protein